MKKDIKIKRKVIASLLATALLLSLALVVGGREEKVEAATVTTETWGYEIITDYGDTVEIGNRDTEDFRGIVKVIRYDDVCWYSLGLQGGGVYTPTLVDDHVNFDWNSDIHVSIYPTSVSGRQPEGGMELDVILDRKQASVPEITLELNWEGITWQKLYALDVEYDEARCEADFDGVAPYTITPTLITDDVGTIWKTREEYEVNSYIGTATTPHDSIDQGTSPDPVHHSLSRTHLYIHRGQMTDADSNTAWVEDINIDEENKTITFTLPTDWLKFATYPVSQVCGVDPAYTEEMVTLDFSGFSDATWNKYDIYTNDGVDNNAVAEIILENQQKGTDNEIGVRHWGWNTSRKINIHECEPTGGGEGDTHCRMFTQVIGDYKYLFSSGNNVYALCTLGDYMYVGGVTDNTVHKVSLTTRSKVDATTTLDGVTTQISTDGTYIYSQSGDYIYKIDPSDMSVLDSYDIGSSYSKFCIANGYIYIEYSLFYIRKLDTATLSYQATSSSVSTTIVALATDGDYIYVGRNNSEIYKLDADDLSYVDATSESINWNIDQFLVYGGYLYGRGSDSYIEKYDTSDMSLVTTGSTLTSVPTCVMGTDGTYIYGVSYEGSIKIDLSTLAEVGSSDNNQESNRAGYYDSTHHLILTGDEGGYCSVINPDTFEGEGLDSSGYIEVYTEDVSDLAAYLVGYWENESFIEEFDEGTCGGSDAWEDIDLQSGMAALVADRVYHIVSSNNAEAAYTVGARTGGSGLSRSVLSHEAEGGGSNYLDFIVKTDASGDIEIYDDDANVSYINLGYFSEELDFVEGFTDITPVSAGSWEDVDLTTSLDQDGRVVDILLVNTEEAADNLLGVRDGDDTSTVRALYEHEAEGGGNTGFSLSGGTNASGVVHVYVADTTNNNAYFMGYFKPAGISSPTVTTSAATLVTATTARLNGAVTATGGENPTVTFYWGDNNGGETPGSWDYSSTADSPSQPQGVASCYEDVTSLSEGVLTYFICSATNSVGTGWGTTLSFTPTGYIPKPGAGISPGGMIF